MVGNLEHLAERYRRVVEHLALTDGALARRLTEAYRSAMAMEPELSPDDVPSDIAERITSVEDAIGERFFGDSPEDLSAGQARDAASELVGIAFALETYDAGRKERDRHRH